ncbi:hypothetical protein VR010_13255 [Actinomycetaceae bacterium L2_0104]
MVFLVNVVQDPGRIGIEDAALADNVAAIVAVVMFSAIPAIIVLGNVGSGVVLNMQHRIVLWKLAGATPRQCGLIATGQLSAACLVGALAGVMASLPFLAPLTHVLLTMAGSDTSSMAATATSGALAVCLSYVIGLFGSLRPLRVAGRVRMGSALRETETKAGGRPVARAALAVTLAVSALLLTHETFNADPSATLDSGLNTALGSGVLILCTMAVASRWLIPWTARWGWIVPRRISPSWALALNFARANPGRITATNLPFLVAAGIAAIFSGLFITWQRALQANASSEILNSSDTIALIAPAVTIGLVGAAGQVLLSRRRRLLDFALLRISGASRRTLYTTAASEVVLGSATVFLLSTALALLVSAMTSHVLTVNGLSAGIALNWPLHLGIIAAGFILTASIGISAAQTASQGNPRHYLATR